MLVGHGKTICYGGLLRVNLVNLASARCPLVFCAVALKAIQRGLIDKLVFVNFGSTLSENE